MRQIIAFGDGGTNQEYPEIDLYILKQSKSPKPSICFLPTASGDNQGYINYFMSLFKNYPCIPDYLSLFHPHTKDIEDYLMGFDVIYVGGGQSKSMMAVWRGWDVDQILKKAYQNETILSGGSAGSVCWFDQCITDSIPGSLTVMNGLGVLPYSNSPHYLSKERRQAYKKFLKSGEIKNGYAAADYAALHFIDEQWTKSVSSRHFSKTYYMSVENGNAIQKKLPTEWLGAEQYYDK